MICCTCKQDKEETEFHFENRELGFRVRQCKICNSIATKRYRDVHKDKINKRTREFRQQNFQHRIVWVAKQRSKWQSLAFDLSPEDIIMPTHCPYLGLELHYTAGKAREDSTASLDRIIPELGYVKGNVEVISDLANRMKNSASKEYLILFATEVLKRHDPNK